MYPWTAPIHWPKPPEPQTIPDRLDSAPSARRCHRALEASRCMLDREIESFRIRLVPCQSLQRGHLLALTHACLSHRIAQHRDALVVSSSIHRERMSILTTVRIGIIGPLPAGLLL